MDVIALLMNFLETDDFHLEKLLTLQTNAAPRDIFATLRKPRSGVIVTPLQAEYGQLLAGNGRMRKAFANICQRIEIVPHARNLVAAVISKQLNALETIQIVKMTLNGQNGWTYQKVSVLRILGLCPIALLIQVS